MLQLQFAIFDIEIVEIIEFWFFYLKLAFINHMLQITLITDYEKNIWFLTCISTYPTTFMATLGEIVKLKDIMVLVFARV